MPASNVQAAFRHLVQTLKKCAKLYNVPDDGVSNAMKPAVAKALWWKVALRVHPDQKGNPKDDAHLKELNDAKERWEAASKKHAKPDKKHRSAYR